MKLISTLSQPQIESTIVKISMDTTLIENYINQLKRELITGSALEHSYRPALKELFESLSPVITAQNDPIRSAHGSPDFIFINKTNRNFIHGYAETKDIYVDLNQLKKRNN